MLTGCRAAMAHDLVRSGAAQTCRPDDASVKRSEARTGLSKIAMPPKRAAPADAGKMLPGGVVLFGGCRAKLHRAGKQSADGFLPQRMERLIGHCRARGGWLERL